MFIDFDVLSYVSFKSYKYDMRNSEAILAKGRFRTDVFKFSFFNNHFLQIMSGIQPDTFISALLSTNIWQSVGIS